MVDGVIYLIAVCILCITLYFALRYIYRKEKIKEDKIEDYRKKVIDTLEALLNEKTNNQ